MRRITLRQRIALGAGALVLLVLVASALGLWYARSSVAALDGSQEGVQQINRLTELETAWNGVSSTIDRMLLTRQSTMADEGLAESLVSFNVALGALSDYSFGYRPETIANNAQIVANLQFFGEELNGVVEDIQEASRQRRWAQAQVLRHTELSSLQDRFDVRLAELRRTTSEDVDALVAQSTQRQRQISIYLTIGLVIAIVLGTTFTLLSVRAIVDPINQLIERTRRVTEGDFSYAPPMERDDEIGHLASSFSIMTCLLYTSPSPRDRTRSRMPSSA